MQTTKLDLLVAMRRVPSEHSSKGRDRRHLMVHLAARRAARRPFAARLAAWLRRLAGKGSALPEAEGRPVDHDAYFIRSATGIGFEIVHSSTTPGLPALVSTIR